MELISTSDWELINDIVLSIYNQDDLRDMRRIFLEKLRRLVVYDMGEFSLGDQHYRFYDSVEVNNISDEKVRILEKYYEYKDLYGNFNIDWIFKNSNSIVMRDRDIIRGQVFEETKFYTVFLKSIDMEYSCTLSLAMEGNFLGELTIYLSDGFGNFTDRDIHILNIFKDHLTNILFKKVKKENSTFLTANQYAALRKLNLSDREIEVFQLAFHGMSNMEIADKLYISANTVKKHLGSIFGKLNIKSRSQLKDMDL
jgi:DNA-binding CsgD family transcriptional regulator